MNYCIYSTNFLKHGTFSLIFKETQLQFTSTHVSIKLYNMRTSLKLTLYEFHFFFYLQVLPRLIFCWHQWDIKYFVFFIVITRIQYKIHVIDFKFVGQLQLAQCSYTYPLLAILNNKLHGISDCWLPQKNTT